MFNKILLIFNMIFLIVLPNAYTDKMNSFLNDINEAYDVYVLKERENDYYHFILSEGVCNDKVCFGVFLGNKESNSYDVYVYVNNKKYYLNEDKRGDVSELCINVNNSSNIRVCVYDKYDSLRFEEEIEFLEKSEYYSLNNIIKGNNQGCELSNIKSRSSFNIIYVFLIISGICIFIILYLFVFKKGIFNKENKHYSEVDFFSFKKEEDDNIEVNETIETSFEKEEVYEKKYYYEEDEEDFDVIPYLRKNNFKEDYLLMNEDEKKEVMLMLMHLRHDKIISENQYQKEVIELWKK